VQKLRWAHTAKIQQKPQKDPHFRALESPINRQLPLAAAISAILAGGAALACYALGGVDISWIAELAVVSPVYYFAARARAAPEQADGSRPAI